MVRRGGRRGEKGRRGVGREGEAERGIGGDAEKREGARGKRGGNEIEPDPPLAVREWRRVSTLPCP